MPLDEIAIALVVSREAPLRRLSCIAGESDRRGAVVLQQTIPGVGGRCRARAKVARRGSTLSALAQRRGHRDDLALDQVQGRCLDRRVRRQEQRRGHRACAGGSIKRSPAQRRPRRRPRGALPQVRWCRRRHGRRWSAQALCALSVLERGLRTQTQRFDLHRSQIAAAGHCERPKCAAAAVCSCMVSRLRCWLLRMLYAATCDSARLPFSVVVGGTKATSTLTLQRRLFFTRRGLLLHTPQESQEGTAGESAFRFDVQRQDGVAEVLPGMVRGAQQRARRHARLQA